MNAPTDAPLYGLVLAGGKSRRMGRDKALIEFDGKAQLARAVELLRGRCEQVFVSVRADQTSEPTRARYPQIVDADKDGGPAAGIAAAQAARPDAAWLVLACDLPRIDAATIDYLIAERDATRDATVFASSHDELPEPLCAIWEPSTRTGLRAALDRGRGCPRKFLIGADRRLLTQPDRQALDNINTRADLAELAAE